MNSPSTAIRSAVCWEDFDKSLELMGNTEKGSAFEELTRLHLMTSPLYSSKIIHVWHHADVPQKIVDELGLQRPEIGVDLVAQINDGSYWAIQCKFHQNSSQNVSYDEIKTFLSITEREKTYSLLSHRLVCTSAMGVSHKVTNAHPYKMGFLTSSEFTKLGEAEFDAFRRILDGEVLVHEPYLPRQHQSKAVRKSEEHFNIEKNSRGKIIHPCGSGKSLTGYWIARNLLAKTILIAVPSLALVRQTLEVWTRESFANNLDMDWIAVCSDEGVSNTDDPAMTVANLGISVTTDPNVVAQFFSRNSAGPKVVITTYHSGSIVSQGANTANIGFDLAIYDEAHKTVGKRDKTFSHLLFDDNVRVSKRIFMTATERQFKGDSIDILSMDDEDVYGPTIDYLSFKNALEQTPPILCDYKIVTTLVTKAEIKELINSNKFIKSDGKAWSLEADASTFAALITLKKLIKERNIKHVVSFHSSIARSKDFMEMTINAAAHDSKYAALSAFHVSGKDTAGKRSAVLERFVSVSPSLITNARCLTEGVDIPTIDAVLFADPKQSKIDIVQAAGRAMRKYDGKEFGYIIVPIVIDENTDEQLGNAFSQVINVISALGMSDERIVDEFKAVILGKNRGGNIAEFSVTDTHAEIEFRQLLSDIDILIWDRLSFAKSVIGESEFLLWMRESTKLSEKSIKNYSNAIRKISNDLVRLKLSYSSLEEMVQSENLDDLKKDYFDIPEYKALDVRGKGMYSAGFNKLIEFHRSKKKEINRVD
jgi:predicted helicase